MITSAIRGREGELALLRAILNRLSEGRGQIAVIEGPIGIGKTRLAEEAAAIARSAGVEVVVATADQATQIAPLAPLLEALAQLDPSEVRRRLAPETLADAVDRRFWVVDEVRSMLEDRARERPLLVVAEDVHWADPTTLLALRLAPRWAPNRHLS